MTVLPNILDVISISIYIS